MKYQPPGPITLWDQTQSRAIKVWEKREWVWQCRQLLTDGLARVYAIGGLGGAEAPPPPRFLR